MVPVTTSTFGALLRQHRIAAGLTQEALAERAGLSVYGVQKLERGITHPYRDTAERLAEALDLAPDEADRFRAVVEPVRRRGSLPREPDGRDGRSNLPVTLTSFVGREQELASISGRLRPARLLTLTGVGGSGKSRLAVEVARGIADSFRDGVQLVELAPITDAVLVADRVATVLRIPIDAERTPEQALADAMRNTHQLLVLDNCEHLLNACAVLVDVLLRECPGLQILATSREPLGIQGEVIWSLAPLETPDETSASVSEIERSPAVRLFVERAAAVQSSFVLDAGNADAIAEICRRLDGMPLALELAAARLDALTPRQLANRLDQRFALLTGGNRAAPPRHQTLGATIEWSYLLLTEVQQRVFERLAVFSPGWTLEAAEVVCAGDSLAESEVLDALLQLSRKSLVVRVSEREGAARYGMLETVRQYAWDRLADRSSELLAVRERHATYYSTVVQRLDPAWRTTLLPFAGETLSAPVFEVLDDTHENVRLALRWWLDNGRVAEGLVLIRALGPLWMWRGVPVDGRRWFEATLDLAAQSADTLGFPRAIHAHALFFGGVIATMQGDYGRGRAFSEASVALWRSLGDPVGLAQGLNGLGLHHTVLGNYEQAAALLDEALALASSVGDPLPWAAALFALGNLARVRQEYERAVSLLRESMSVARTMDRPSYQALSINRSLMYLAQTESKRGASNDALSLFKEALAGMREWGIVGDVLACCLDWFGAELGRSGDPLRAAQLFGAAEAQWHRAGARRFPIDQSSFENDVRAIRDQFDDVAFANAWSDGQAMDLARLFAFVLDEIG